MNTSNPAAEAIDQLHPDIRPDDSTRKEHASAYHANTWDMFMDFGAADSARSSVDGTVGGGGGCCSMVSSCPIKHTLVLV